MKQTTNKSMKNSRSTREIIIHADGEYLENNSDFADTACKFAFRFMRN